MLMTRANAFDRDRGFTLIEMMVTLAVLAIIVAVAVPAFSDFMEKARLRGAADALSSQFSLARSQAVRSGRDVRLLVVGEDAEWCTGARQYAASGVVGLVDASGSATCNCATNAAQCLVANEQSVVTSTGFAGVVLKDANGLDFQFDRRTGALVDLTQKTLKLRSEANPGRFGLDLVTTPMGHARTCIPAGFASFGGFKPC